MLFFPHRRAGLLTACASILCLLPSQRASADATELALALEGGVAWTHASYTYQPFELEGPGSGSVSLVGPATALHAELSWKVAPILRVGGFARLGLAGAPTSAFIDAMDVQGSVGLGRRSASSPRSAPTAPTAVSG